MGRMQRLEWILIAILVLDIIDVGSKLLEKLL